MRKSLVGAILCVMVTYNASASIISRGFFDEAMENYATNTALDLKANQTDLTTLSEIVGTPMELTYGDILSPYIRSIMGNVYYDTYADNTVPTNDISELINLNYTDTSFPGLAGVVQSLFERQNGDEAWPIRLYGIFDDYEYLFDEGNTSFTDLIINGGKLGGMGVTVYGLPDLTTKIGTLPSGEIVSYGPPLIEMLQHYSYQYPKDLAGIYDVLFGTEENIGVLERFATSTLLGAPNSFSGLYSIGTVPDGKNLVGMIDEINTKIGTLPDGLTVANLYDGWTDSKGVIHNGLNDLSTITNNIDLSVEGPIAALMGYENGHKTRVKAVLNQLFMPIPEYPSLYNLGWRILEGGDFPKFAQEMYGIPGYKGLVDLTKGVGDLPSGNFPPFIGSGPVFPELNQPLTYPTSLAELINAIYGNLETGQIGLLAAIISGFPDTDGDGQSDSTPGILPNFWLANDAKNLANANATKIGDLPTEYATVGAALTAMDAKITAKNLPSTSDDGQYVLTAKKVGETITYTWVKMDLTNEEQIQ